jgi:hypothetical protein
MHFIHKHFDFQFFKQHVKSIITNIEFKSQLSQCFNAAVEEGVFDERIGLMMCMNEMKPIKVQRMMQVDDRKQRIKTLLLI